MKVLLINSESLYIKQKAAIPLGLLSIATFLTSNGHTVRIYDRAVEKKSVKTQLDDFKPDIVGIAAPASFNDALKISRIVKERSIPVIWGGQVTSLIPDIVLKSGVVDFVVVGEGEITMLALINALINKTSFHSVDGIVFIEDGKIITNKEREFAELSQLPIIDFSYVDPTKYWIKNSNYDKLLFVYATKGCPFSCSYCYNSCLSKGIWRARPAEYVLSEIKYLIENFGMEGVYFTDDLFFSNKAYLKSFCNSIIDSGLKFVWSCEARADCCTREDLQLMYDTGCRWIFFGIESGSEEMQIKLRKGLDLQKARKTIEICREIGITTTTSFMLGFVDETEDEIRKTVEYAKSVKADSKIAFKFKPIPKSKLYEELIREKRISEPRTLKDCKNFTWMDALYHNYSKVPDKDLKVISSFFYLSLLRNGKKDKKSESRGWTKRLFFQTLDILKRGSFKSIILLILSAKELFEIMYYAVFFPKVRRKYGLDFKKNK